jgi:hypothetical protein
MSEIKRGYPAKLHRFKHLRSMNALHGPKPLEEMPRLDDPCTESFDSLE